MDAHIQQEVFVGQWLKLPVHFADSGDLYQHYL